MSDFDEKLHKLLTADDEAFIADSIDEKGYYKEALSSLKGQGSLLRIATWVGIFVASGFLIYCIWKLFHATTTREMILFATFAILLNSAQIALKLWFNMQLNRRIVIRELKRLHLAIAQATR